MLVVRVFELWTHGDDVRQATGRPLDLLDEARLSLMVTELIASSPSAWPCRAVPNRRTARLELTGPGGGVFDVSLDPAWRPGRPRHHPHGPVIDLCRVAANRLDHHDFPVLVEGDRALLEPS